RRSRPAPSDPTTAISTAVSHGIVGVRCEVTIVDIATAGPLAGFTVAVTVVRHCGQLATLLESHGARVVVTPVVRIVPYANDAELRAATATCVERPADLVVDAGSDGSNDVLGDLLDRGVAGLRIAVQTHGEPQPELCAQLRAAGADVIEVPLGRWAPPVDLAPVHRLIDLIDSRLVDAVTFTSAAAVRSLLALGGPPVLDRLRDRVTAACIGPAAAAPLVTRGVPVIAPEQARSGALVRVLADELPRKAPTLMVAGTAVTVRGHAAVVGGTLKPLAPGPMAVLRALAEARGLAMSRAARRRGPPPRARARAGGGGRAPRAVPGG